MIGHQLLLVSSSRAAEGRTLEQVLVEQDRVVLVGAPVAGRALEVEDLLELTAVEEVLHYEEVDVAVLLAEADAVDAKDLGEDGRFLWVRARSVSARSPHVVGERERGSRRRTPWKRASAMY